MKLKQLIKIVLLALLSFMLFWYALEVQSPSVGFAGSPQAQQPVLSVLLAAAGTLTMSTLYRTFRHQQANFKIIILLDIALLLVLAAIRS